MKGLNTMPKILVAALWCVVSMGCVAEETASSPNKKERQYHITSQMNPGLCGQLLELVKTGKGKELSESVEPLSGIDGVSFPNRMPVNASDYEQIILKVSAPVLNPDSKEYAEWKAEAMKYKYYLAKVNYDNEGADEFVLSYEATPDARHINNERGHFYVLKDEKSIYPKFEEMKYGRLFLYNGISFLLDAGDNIYSIKRLESAGSQIFGTSTFCNINR